VVAGLLVVGGLMACGVWDTPPERQFYQQTSGIFATEDQAVLVGEGACELLELGKGQEAVDIELARLGYEPDQREIIIRAMDEHLCPDEGEKADD
jgi:hypothetical protein